MTTNGSDAPASAPALAQAGGMSCVLAWTLLALLLITNGPLFVCMPLTEDAAMYDLQARTWLQGGVLYRDIVEPNLPGAAWIHAAIRATLGTSSVALRSVDLLLISGVVALSRAWLVRLGGAPATVAWSVLLLFLCYFSLSEWCHCQRDGWLLLPGLAGLTLRQRQWQRLRCAPRPRMPGLVSTAGWAILEGMCWGAGVWLKPMIAIPALGVWLLSLLYIGNWRRSLADLFGLLSGGLLMGGIGVAVLVWSDAWPFFWTMLVEWNPRYVAAGREQWTVGRFAAMQVRFFPWQLLHLVAIPVALTAVGRAIKKSWTCRTAEVPNRRNAEGAKRHSADAAGSRSLERSDSSTLRLLAFSALCVFYLAWLLQSYLLQHLFDYVHAPGLLLAIVVLAGRVAVRSPTGRKQDPVESSRVGNVARFAARKGVCVRRGGLALAGFVGLVLLTTPVVRLGRLNWWWRCVREGSTAEVRDGLKYFSVPSWRDLERVADFLCGQGLADQQLTCYHNSLIHLYGMLGVKPSTRHAYLEQAVAFFPERHPLFLQSLRESRQRYVVTDLVASGLSPDRINQLAPEGVLPRPPRFPSRLREVYPWSQPAIFRAGPYLVHQVRPPLGHLESPRSLPAEAIGHRR